MSSQGQQLLADYLTVLIGKIPQQDARPEWLGGMELDLFYPEFDLAFEYQGQFHYAPIRGTKTLQKQQRADKLKLDLCEANGVLLVRLDLVHLRHPQLTERIMNRFSQAYGPNGPARFFRICGENPLSRNSLFGFNLRFDKYRENEMTWRSPGQLPGNAKQRRRLKRAMHRRTG